MLTTILDILWYIATMTMVYIILFEKDKTKEKDKINMKFATRLPKSISDLLNKKEERLPTKTEKLDKYNGPKDTIYLNFNDTSDMRCPYQLMTVKHDGFANGDLYIHVRLKDNKIMVDTMDKYTTLTPSDTLNTNTNYDFIHNVQTNGYILTYTDNLYHQIIKDNKLKDKTYQEVYMYLKQKNDNLRLTSDEIDIFKDQFNKAKIEYNKYIENIKPKYDFNDQKRELQIRDDLKEVLDKLK